MPISQVINTKNDFVPDASYFNGFQLREFFDQEAFPFSIAGCRHDIFGLDQNLRSSLGGIFEGFTDNFEEAFSRTQIFRTDRKYFLHREKAVDTLKVEFEDDFLIITSLHFSALCDMSMKTPNKLILCGNELEVQTAAAMNYLSTYFANYLLLFKGCFFLHSSGIVMDDGAYILYGPSTSGKSTASSFADEKGFPVLNDELVIVRASGGECLAYSAPLRGKYNVRTQKGYPIKGFYRLVKADQDSISPIPKGRAVAEILASTFYSAYYFKNSEGEVFRLVQQLVQQVPCFHLRFRKDFTFLEILKGSQE